MKALGLIIALLLISDAMADDEMIDKEMVADRIKKFKEMRYRVNKREGL